MSSKVMTTNLQFDRITLHQFGAPEQLQLVKQQLIPKPQKGLLIEVLAIGVGYVDVMAQRGGYIFAPKLPFSPGYELVGRLLENHDDPAWTKGDLVAALLPKQGAYRSLIEVPAARLVKLPTGANVLKSAASILNYLTAYAILERQARVENGAKVLIHGASGGVGVALAQIGQHKELVMYGTASAAKHDLVRELGVVPIDYRNEDFVPFIRQRHPEGIDAAFDAIGGDNLVRSMAVVKRGGRVVSYGFSGNNYGGRWEALKGMLQFLKYKILPNGKKILACGTPGISVQDPAWYRATLKRILQQVREEALNPPIARIYPLKKAAEAHRFIETGQVRGKVMLTTEAFHKLP